MAEGGERWCSKVVFEYPQNPGAADIRRLLSSSPPLVAVAKETIQQSEDEPADVTNKAARVLWTVFGMMND